MNNTTEGIQLKDVIHFYLGCECKVGDYKEIDYIRMVNETGLSVCTGTDKHDKPIWYRTISIKPILRKLSDRTEYEGYFCDGIINKFDDTDQIEQIKCLAATTIYLLKQGFDLFGLIESNQAIDKTLLP